MSGNVTVEKLQKSAMMLKMGVHPLSKATGKFGTTREEVRNYFASQFIVEGGMNPKDAQRYLQDWNSK